MASSSIPLHCNICPKKPNFSDVSHLLTHIASKGHLSHYYKVKVRSGTEEASRRLIETYDRWYAEWGVEDLMSERMSQKEKRRTRTRAPGTLWHTAFHPVCAPKTDACHVTAPRPNPVPRPVVAAPQHVPYPQPTVNTVLDPRLSDQRPIKVETSVTPTPPPLADPRYRPFPPRLPFWAPPSRSMSRGYDTIDYENSSDISDPRDRRPYAFYGYHSSAILDEEPAVLSTEDAGGSECTKLKGVLWPGMDIFDSATPDMRRKRNQKKDISVLEQLELNSQDVEPTEFVFSPLGTLRKQRRISNSMLEDSPIKGETPPSQQITRRPVLAELDTNVPVHNGRRPRQYDRPPPPFPNLSRGSYEMREPSFGYGGYELPKKRAFDVFQDQEVSFAQPAAMNYLTSELHRPHPSHSPALPPFKSYHDHYHYAAKENGMPAYSSQAYHHAPPAEPNDFLHAGYYHGAGHDHHHHGLYQNPLYLQQYHHHTQSAATDQRTLTTPRSPSTG